ncbi:MAG: NUDIX hydrolase [Pseudomonadota bacterium]
MLRHLSTHLQDDILLLPNKIKRTARVLILKCNNSDLQYYALWQHKKHKGINRLVLPGGQIQISLSEHGEIKQEKVIATAIRETLEEISVAELNLKYYLGAYSRNMAHKGGYKHTYLFIGRIKGKPKVKETDKFDSKHSSFYPLATINKYPHAPHLQWVYKQYKKGGLDRPISRFIS